MNLGEYVERFQTLQLQQSSSNKLIEDVILYAHSIETVYGDENRRLSKAYADAKLDLDDSRNRRRELQQEINAVSRQLSQSSMENDSLKNRNPYVMVLIDGDGTIFNESYIRQGLDGGKKAANALRNAVLEEYDDLPDDVEVIARVCANFTGLAKAMKRDGVLDSYDDFHDFTLGFTQAKASFDFIDVGYGKERADSKIREATRWNLQSYNCKHILLGVSHDAGYAPFLDEMLRDESTRRRITIIEGSPIVRELQSTGVRIITLKNIFRNKKLIDRQSASTTGSLVPTPASSSTNGNGSTSSTPSSTWASVTSAQPKVPPPLVFPVAVAVKNGVAAANNAAAAATVTTPHPKLDWEPGPRGLDSSLHIPASALAHAKKRQGSDKLCNNHYLRGPCNKPDCPFEHEQSVSEDEVRAIAYLTRLNPCVNGQDCDAEWCIYGHHCPSWGLDLSRAGGVRAEEGVCAAFSCRFGEEGHPPGTVIRTPKKWD